MWNDINFPGLGIIALKAIAIYAFIILAIRIFGKKELSQLSVVDLVFILLISNSVQNAMVGSDNTVLGGIAAATGLFVVNYILKLVIRRYPGVSNILQGHALMLIHQGKVIRENLDRSFISMDELKAAAREHGVEEINEVDLAILEVDGNISVMSKDYSKKTVFRNKAHKLMRKK
jgi:uncharacterized membrane protein YcaP (DUF421 family)